MTLLELINEFNERCEELAPHRDQYELAMMNFANRLQGDAVATLIAEVKLVLECHPSSRERSLVMTKLEEAELWYGKMRR